MIVSKLGQYALTLLLLCGLATMAVAQDHDGHEKKDDDKPLYFSEYMNIFNGSAEKIAGLGEAIPEDKYDWRPDEGIRSVKESMMHVAAANFFLASRLGADMPEGLDPRTLETSIEGKEAALKVLMQSFDHVRMTIKGMTHDDLATEVDVFGTPGNKMRVMMIIGEHMAEHQGQLIAYARMNGVVPPWSQPSE